ncbi:MAG: DUF2892 domain-containing protein [Chloroherpetonaceae bacterium]
MIQNMGSLDKGVRLVLAAIFVGLYFTNVVSGTLGIVLLVLAGIFALTSFVGSCPLYLPFKISTKKEGK